MDRKRAVITGTGVVSPVGNTTDDFWNSLKVGKNGIGPITRFNLTDDFKVSLAAEVKDFDATQYIDKRKAKRMALFAQYAMVGAIQALAESGLALGEEDPYRLGAIIGVGMGCMHTIQEETKKLIEKGPKRISPLFIPTVIPNMAAGNIAIEYGLKGPVFDVTTACASGTNAMGEAFRAIQSGYADVVFTGGAENVTTELTVAGFTALTALSESKDPNRASIPFDKERSGFVMGEGAGIVVLEEYEHAKARGATILAEVVGYSTTCDAFHITAPEESGEAMARAMELAMKDAGITPKDISYINAHGTSTFYNELVETRAIKTAFGDEAYRIPISSIKSMVGHGLGAAGGIEAIACVKALQEGFIPPTINYRVPDPELDLDYVPNVGREQDLTYAMSDNLGFGGHNAVIILKKWDAEV
ncbi:beta-ketoacyl-ACP synthase II [Bianquea renquensis]|uniref:3-oxoacyl-[acyl-carrier-protein] synthase 2 n=1 Tax=Bianquea renquensis TaxID=2763661 RepID=A0A926DT76_9FIRM|nr:beta-ketoacyl-ACP synthase II [Bianquea renquensis]MBC8544853.1 beta-ketoacyl-ACP synthase II [Bianquea renquensis]